MMLIVRDDSQFLHSTVNLILAYIDPEKPSDSISEHLFFKSFLGGMPPDPSSISMLRMLIVLRTITHTFSHYTKMSRFICICSLGPLNSLMA